MYETTCHNYFIFDSTNTCRTIGKSQGVGNRKLTLLLNGE